MYGFGHVVYSVEIVTILMCLLETGLLAVLGTLDTVFMNYAYHSTLTKGASVQLVFGFEVSCFSGCCGHLTC